jgi:uncharacterized membrane protein YeaQ/YmgE (transglycosylase-associated protein family)
MLNVLALIIVGIAAGFVATRLMRIEADLVTTSAIGVLGVVAGVFLLRLLLVGATLLGYLAGALAGAMVVAWAYKRLFQGG